MHRVPDSRSLRRLALRARNVLLLTLLGLAALAPRRAAAGWPRGATTNVPVCTAALRQDYPVTVPDGAGGALVAWDDYRVGGGYSDIYAQHLVSGGSVDANWPPYGVAICTAIGSQSEVGIASDGVGGAFLAWLDARNVSDYNIYAMHLLSSGVVDPNWPIDGLAVCTAIRSQERPVVLADGAGGVYVGWEDFRYGTSSDIFAQRLTAAGTLSPGWPANGLGVCTASGHQRRVRLVRDQFGGCFAAWDDARGGAAGAYAAHLFGNGSLDPAWAVGGVAACGLASASSNPEMVADGQGGIDLVWLDRRNVGGLVYAQHMNGSGSVEWGTNGVAVCSSGTVSDLPVALADGAGGFFVSWGDNATGNTDVYTHHVLANGILDARWPIGGTIIWRGAHGSSYPETSLLADGAGGLFLAFVAGRGNLPAADIAAVHVLYNGGIDPAWPLGDAILCEANGGQYHPTLVPDGHGGGIAIWEDYRAGGVDGADLYAQRFESFGHLGEDPAPVITLLRDIPNDQGGKVKLAFRASELEPAPYKEINYYQVYRSVAPNAAARALAKGATLALTPREAEAGAARGRVFITAPRSASGYAWEYVTSISPANFASYSVVTATASDSTADSNRPTAFLVRAIGDYGQAWWDSAPDSVYSVDNLAPAQPRPFSGQPIGTNTALHWGVNTERDLRGYRLYRGLTPDFRPGPATFVVEQPDTGYVDGGANYYYRLSAVDIHGNESPFAFLAPHGIVGVGGGGAVGLSLSAATPNPTRGATTIAFGLTQPAEGELALYDVRGARVRVLVRGALAAGPQSVSWDGRAEDGAPAPAGVYFYRLTAGGATRAGRVLLAR